MFSRITLASLMVIAVAAMAPVSALTFKKGQVLGADGEVYDGASPEQKEALIEKAKEEAMKSTKKDGDGNSGGSSNFVSFSGGAGAGGRQEGAPFGTSWRAPLPLGLLRRLPCSGESAAPLPLVAPPPATTPQ